MTIEENSVIELLKSLSSVPDPRELHRVRYPLDEILFLVVSAVVSDCHEWGEIADFGRDKLGWLRKYRLYLAGTPSHDTLNRVFSLIKVDSFSSIFREWATKTLKLKAGSLVSLDGKVLRGSATKLEQQTPHAAGGKSAVYLVEAWCDEHSLCFDLQEIRAKENEIVAIPLILNNLEVEGCVIRIDAIGCQKEIVRKIRSQKTDYVIGLKRNQETLMTAVEVLFLEPLGAVNFDTHDSKEELGHGRIERRICRVASVDGLPEWACAGDWDGFKSVIEVQSERIVIATAKVSSEKRYYISSLPPVAETNAAYVRNHWGIENRLHYCLNVFFGEDKSRKRAGNAATNFGTVLRLALNLVNADNSKMPIKRKRKKAARQDKFRETLLGFS